MVVLNGLPEGMRGVKRVYDEIHGYIELTKPEIDIVDTPTFQRLRYIKQLASAWYVYPGATHTRFSHSLGVMHIMGIMATKLYREGYIYSKDDVQLLRIVALLHDVGHTPFSHAIEPYYSSVNPPLTHEELTKLIVLRDPYIRSAIEDNGFDPWSVVAILEGRHREPLFNQLLSGDLDVDRMDYLLRDALHTGVTYGAIDVHRIIATITVDREGSLAVAEKGLEALENFYLARLHMYRAVYYHKSIVGYELLVRIIYEKLMESYRDNVLASRLATVQGVRKLVEEGKIFFWHDSWFLGLMVEALEDPSVDNEVKELIRAFLFRRGYKVIVDYSRFSDDELEEDDEEVMKLRILSDKLRRYVGGDRSNVMVFIDDIPIITVEEAIRVAMDDGSSISAYNHPRSLIKFMPRRFHVKRLYVLSSVHRKALQFTKLMQV
ncbi:MAG: HD domain-containing protein [Thermoprotei archaeon]|nr:MAG: HD domain-containing protein [Thermoprotei archaeon]